MSLANWLGKRLLRRNKSLKNDVNDEFALTISVILPQSQTAFNFSPINNNFLEGVVIAVSLDTNSK